MFEVLPFDGPYVVSRPASRGLEIILGRSGTEPHWLDALHPTVVLELSPDPTRALYPPKLVTSKRFSTLNANHPALVNLRWLHGQGPSVSPYWWTVFTESLDHHDSLLVLADEDDASMLWMAEALVRRGLGETLPALPHYLTRRQRTYLEWPRAAEGTGSRPSPATEVARQSVTGLPLVPPLPEAQWLGGSVLGGYVVGTAASGHPTTPEPQIPPYWEAEGERNGTD